MRKIKRKKDGVVILGCSDRFNFYGAADDFEWWSMNNCYRSHPEVDFTRWFEIHRIEKAGGRFLRRDSANIGEGTVDDYLTDLNGLGIPVYMQRKWREIKKIGGVSAHGGAVAVSTRVFQQLHRVSI